jgi:hypothetical protein
MSAIVQPPTADAGMWPAASPDHPLDGPQRPSWVASIPEDLRAFIAETVTNGVQKFWDAASVAALIERGLSGDEALAMSYRLVACAVECSAVLADLDALGTDADLMAVATAAGDAR